jgi:hypothetical protein
MVTPDPSRHHPVVEAEQAQRTASLQLRVADWITGFAGSYSLAPAHHAVYVGLDQSPDLGFAALPGAKRKAL